VYVVQLFVTPQVTGVQEQLFLIQRSFVHGLLSLQSEFLTHIGAVQRLCFVQIPNVALVVTLSQDHEEQLVSAGHGIGVYKQPFELSQLAMKHGLGAQVIGAMEQQLDEISTVAEVHKFGALQLIGLIQEPQEQIPQHPVQVLSSTSQAVAEILCTKAVKSDQD
jgi:hypothetical protein